MRMTSVNGHFGLRRKILAVHPLGNAAHRAQRPELPRRSNPVQPPLALGSGREKAPAARARAGVLGTDRRPPPARLRRSGGRGQGARGAGGAPASGRQVRGGSFTAAANRQAQPARRLSERVSARTTSGAGGVGSASEQPPRE